MSVTTEAATDRRHRSVADLLDSGVITEVKKDKLAATVEIQAGPHRVLAFITREAADQMGLKAGMQAVAAVKATNVTIELPEGAPEEEGNPAVPDPEPPEADTRSEP